MTRIRVLGAVQAYVGRGPVIGRRRWRLAVRSAERCGNGIWAANARERGELLAWKVAPR